MLSKRELVMRICKCRKQVRKSYTSVLSYTLAGWSPGRFPSRRSTSISSPYRQPCSSVRTWLSSGRGKVGRCTIWLLPVLPQNRSQLQGPPLAYCWQGTHAQEVPSEDICCQHQDPFSPGNSQHYGRWPRELLSCGSKQKGPKAGCWQ